VWLHLPLNLVQVSVVHGSLSSQSRLVWQPVGMGVNLQVLAEQVSVVLALLSLQSLSCLQQPTSALLLQVPLLQVSVVQGS